MRMRNMDAIEAHVKKSCTGSRAITAFFSTRALEGKKSELTSYAIMHVNLIMLGKTVLSYRDVTH